MARVRGTSPNARVCAKFGSGSFLWTRGTGSLNFFGIVGESGTIEGKWGTYSIERAVGGIKGVLLVIFTILVLGLSIEIVEHALSTIDFRKTERECRSSFRYLSIATCETILRCSLI